MTISRRVLALAGSVLLVAACGSTPPSTAPSAAATSSAGASTAVVPPSASTVPSQTSTAAPTAAPATPSPTMTSTPTPTQAPTAEPTAAPPVDEFPQTWTGSWEDPVTGGTGSLSLALTGRGSDFGGTITMDGTACLGDGILNGTYDGDAIEFTVGQRDVEIRFEGEASDAEIRGTFRSDCDGMDGTWQVQRGGR
jgi:hypothetical protein